MATVPFQKIVRKTDEPALEDTPLAAIEKAAIDVAAELLVANERVETYVAHKRREFGLTRELTVTKLLAERDALYEGLQLAALESHTKALGPETTAMQVAAAPFLPIEKMHQSKLDSMASDYAVAHDVPMHVAHEKLGKQSLGYQAEHKAYAATVASRLDAVNGASDATLGMLGKRRLHELKQAAAPASKLTPSEQKLSAHCAAIAKRRGVTPERALADALSSGAHRDDEAMRLYDDAQHERTNAQFGGAA